MSLTIKISPEREAAYHAETLLLERTSADTWEEEFDVWVNSFPDTPPLSDEAISRASLYPDRW